MYTTLINISTFMITKAYAAWILTAIRLVLGKHFQQSTAKMSLPERMDFSRVPIQDIFNLGILFNFFFLLLPFDLR